jgi:hypothetical protein
VGVPDGLSARSDEERVARERLRETGDAIVAGVAVQLPAWVVREVGRILDAWGRVDAGARAVAERDAVGAGERAGARVTERLKALFDQDPAEQRSTPLEIVRTATAEPTEILVGAGVPPVDRDAFAVRSWPDDRYGLVPRTLSDLAPPDGDSDDLGPLHLAWGMSKAAVLRARAEPH